jgi:1-acyl-sn-glycerol-3-phosphate acyltransferase
MELLLQTAGSLVAILTLAGLAWWLRLGGALPLTSEDEVRRISAEIEDGFTPTSIACDEEGAGALARDEHGRILLIRPHGNRFVGRVLNKSASARLKDHPGEFNIVIDSGERLFGRVALTLPEPDAWADAINALNTPQDA